MLEELLRLMADGGLRSYDELAARLAVSRLLVEAMVQNLARLGYLRPAVDACEKSPACRAGCGLSRCSTSPLWTLTGKGARAARQA